MSYFEWQKAETARTNQHVGRPDKSAVRSDDVRLIMAHVKQRQDSRRLLKNCISEQFVRYQISCVCLMSSSECRWVEGGGVDCLDLLLRYMKREVSGYISTHVGLKTDSLLRRKSFEIVSGFDQRVLRSCKTSGAPPQACSLHTPSAGPELPGTEPSPHGRTACLPEDLSWAVGNTGGGSVCAWWKEETHAITCFDCHSLHKSDEKLGDILTKVGKCHWQRTWPWRKGQMWLKALSSSYLGPLWKSWYHCPQRKTRYLIRQEKHH